MTDTERALICRAMMSLGLVPSEWPKKKSRLQHRKDPTREDRELGKKFTQYASPEFGLRVK